MKTVITSTGTDLASQFDMRFGRAHSYCVYNDETGETQFVENEFANAQGGAGTRAAEKMMDLGVKKVISGDFGPKAKDLLQKFQIQMVAINNGNQTVNDIINSIK